MSSNLCLNILFLLLMAFPAFSQEPIPRVFFIDSYHEGYEWSDRIIQGFLDGIESENIDLVIHRMDSKRNPDETYLKSEGLKVRNLIEEFSPDVIVACDDNASRYVAEPFYRDSGIPVVFCGVNWDSGTYGYPWSNATGMVEVNLVEELIRQLGRYTDQEEPRIGYLASDTYTERKEADQYKEKLGIRLDREIYARDYGDWENGFLVMQDDVDILIIGTFVYAEDTQAGAEEFVRREIRIPTGTLNDFLMPYAMLGYMKNPEEFGYWSARTTLDILSGAEPSEIPIVQNRQSELVLNMGIADSLNVIFELDLLRHATIIR